VTFKESTDKILPNLDELHDSIRRIAIDINSRMTTLQTLVESKTKDDHIQSLSNLRKCVQSAASVVSSTSTTLGVESADLATYSSEFGDCFPQEPSETMLRWISSNSTNGSEEGHLVVSKSKRDRNAYEKTMPQLDETSGIDEVDSDEDLEVEMVQSLQRRGKKRLDAKDYAGAERLFRNCLLRTSVGSFASMHQTLKSEIMMLLLQTYRQQEKWTEAQSLLSEKIAMGSRESAAGEVLSDMLLLVEVLLEKGAYAEALLYGRQALKGYRRLGEPGTQGVGESLRHLVKICHADGNVDEEEAYAAILADFVDQQSSILNQVASSSKPEKSWHGVEHTSDSHVVCERPGTNFGKPPQSLASVLGSDESREIPPALPAPSELFGSQQSDPTSTPDIRLPILAPRSELIVAKSSILQDIDNLPDSYPPSSELVINSSPLSQDGFHQTTPDPIPLPSIKSETAKIPRGYSIDTTSVKSEEVFELEGDLFMENPPYLSTQGPPHRQTRSEPPKSGGFLDRWLPPISEIQINHNDFNKPSFSSMRSSEPLSQGLSSWDTGNTSSMSGEVHGSYGPFNYTTDPPSTLLGSTAPSASESGFFSAINDTSTLPSVALQTFSRPSDPSRPSSSASGPNLSDIDVAPPLKSDEPSRSSPQDLLPSLRHLNRKKPERPPSKFVERQNFPFKNGKVRENSTEIEEKEPICSNPITPVNSFLGDSVAKPTIATIKLVIIGDENCGKTSLLMYVR
jgi:hypothetical protein